MIGDQKSIAWLTIVLMILPSPFIPLAAWGATSNRVPTPGPSYKSKSEQSFQIPFAAGTSIPSPTLYAPPGVALPDPNGTAQWVPAPCILKAQDAAGAHTSDADPRLNPITDTTRIDVPKCEDYFPSSGSVTTTPTCDPYPPPAGTPADQVIYCRTAKMLSCFYGGSVTDVNTATQCKDGISTTLGTTPRTVCSVTDGEGKLSLSGNTISSSRNHLGQPCASGTSDGSTAGNFTYLTSWLDSQSLGIWVQGAKATLNQVRTEMQNPAHQINIQSSACQALAQDYLTLLTFSKTLSDDQSSAIMASMPNVAAYDWKTCSPSSSTAKLTLDDSTMLPQASRCMTHAGGSQLLALYLQIAQCEVTGRADDLRAQLASQLNTAMGKMQQIAQDAGQAAQNEVNNDCRKGTYEWDCINSTDAKYCWIAYVAGAALGTGILIACLKEVPKLVSDVQSCAQSKMNQYAQSKQDSNFAASALTAAKSIISTVLQKASTADLDLTQTYSPKALPTHEYPAGSP